MFGLSVGAEVFVAEGMRELVIAVQAGHHQQLLKSWGDWGSA